VTQRILHLAKLEDWSEAVPLGYYSISTRDKTLQEVGFIHASTASQLSKVASFVYRDYLGELLILELDLAQLEAAGLKVLFEDGGNGELFPHIYGPIPVELVLHTKPAVMVEGNLQSL
jgi:uncharacterized protein (DUF952 family)